MPNKKTGHRSHRVHRGGKMFYREELKMDGYIWKLKKMFKKSKVI